MNRDFCLIQTSETLLFQSGFHTVVIIELGKMYNLLAET